MKRFSYKYCILICICLIETLLIGSYFLLNSWFIRADLGSIIGIRKDYSIQLSNDGVLMDTHQMSLNKRISHNITKYMLVNTRDLDGLDFHNILIMEEGSASPPVYIIYDEMLDGYVYINKIPSFVGYWVGGYQQLSSKDEFVQRRYDSLLKGNEWIYLKK